MFNGFAFDGAAFDGAPGISLAVADVDDAGLAEGVPAIGPAAADAGAAIEGTVTILVDLARSDSATAASSTTLVESGATPLGITTFASTGVRVGIDPGRSTGVQL